MSNANMATIGIGIATTALGDSNTRPSHDPELDELRRELQNESAPDYAAATRKQLIEGYRKRSLGCLQPDNWLRRRVIQLVHNKWFDRAMLVIIICNCISLAMNPKADYVNNKYGRLTKAADIIFLAVFSLEMVLKVIAMGFAFAGERSYMRNLWNIIDLIVIISTALNFVPDLESYTLLRSFRLLRPFKAVNSIRGMRIMFSSLVSAIPALWSVFLFAMFVLVVFSIVFQHFYMGKLRYRCIDAQAWEDCGHNPYDTSCVDTDLLNNGPLCATSATSGRHCDVNTSCIDIGVNPNHGIVGFDNIGLSFLTVLTMISQEGWTNYMYYVGDSVSQINYVIFIFMMCVFSMFIMQTNTAVLFIRFNQSKARELRRELLRMQMKRAERAATPSTNRRSIGALQPIDAAELKRMSERVAADEAKELKSPAGNTGTIASPPATTGPAADGASLLSPSMSSHKLGSSQSVSPPNMHRAKSSKSDDSSIAQLYEDDEWAYTNVINRIGRWLPSSPLKHEWQAKLRWLALHKKVDYMFFAFIVCDWALLCGRYYGQPESTRNSIDIANSFFVGCFVLEMLIRLFGLGFTDYMLDGFNAFDGVVTLVAFIDVVSSGGRSALSAVQALRMVRIFKVFEGWRSMRNLLVTILKTLQDLAFYSLVLFLFLFVLAIAGRQLLGKHMGTGDERPRDHYDNIAAALVNSFQISTPENWNTNLEDAKVWKGWAGAIYIVVNYMVLNWVVNSLFVAILLSNFGDDEEDDTTAATGEAGVLPGAEQPPPTGCWSRMWYKFTAPCRRRSEPPQGAGGPTGSEEKQQAAASAASSGQGSSGVTSPVVSAPPSPIPSPIPSPVPAPASSSVAGGVTSPSSPNARGLSMRSPTTSAHGPKSSRGSMIGTATQANRHILADYEMEKTANLIPHYRQDSSASVFSRAARSSMRSKSKAALISTSTYDTLSDSNGDDDELEGVSLYCLHPNNKFRRLVTQFTFSRYFESFVLLVIFVSCVLLALETPSIDEKGTIYKILPTANWIVTGIFLAEMTLKIIAMGFVAHDGSYLRDAWNVLDFLIVGTSLLAATVSSTRFVNSFRALRALRPLRLVANFESTRTVLAALLGSFKTVSNVLLFGVLMFSVLAIIGVQNYQGRLALCQRVPTDDNDDPFSLTTLDQDACLNTTDGMWINPIDMGNFDNVFSAMLVLFELATQENWPTFMYRTIDATPPGYAPSRDYNQSAIIYFVVCIILCSFLYAQLFVGAVVGAFISRRTEDLNERQAKWFQIYKAILEHPPPIKMTAPQVDAHKCCQSSGSLWMRLRKWLFPRVASHRFDDIMLGVVTFNVFLMVIRYTGESDSYYNGVRALVDVCTWLYVCEAIAKMIAYTPMQYFTIGWHRYEFFVVLCCFVDFLLFTTKSFSVEDVPYVNSLIFGVFRVGRIIKWAHRIRALNDVMRTLRFALPAIYNVALLGFVIYFIFAVAGMSLWGQLDDAQYIDDHANFRSFFIALATLYRATTGENWNGLMRDCMVEPPFCSGGNCGSVAQSVIFWVLFEVLTTFLLVGMITAIVVNNFEEEFEDGEAAQQGRALPVSSGDIVTFGRIWWKYARDTGDVIFVDDLPQLFNELDGGLACEGTRSSGPPLYKFIDDLNIPANARCCQFVDVLYRLSQHVFLQRYPGDWKDIDHLPMTHEKMVCVKAQALRQFPRLRREGSAYRWASGAVSRVLLVQRLWRGYKARKQLQAMMVQRLKEQGHDHTIVEALARGEDVDMIELQRVTSSPIIVGGDNSGSSDTNTTITSTTANNTNGGGNASPADNTSLLAASAVSSSSPARDTTPPDSERNSPVFTSSPPPVAAVAIEPIDITHLHGSSATPSAPPPSTTLTTTSSDHASAAPPPVPSLHIRPSTPSDEPSRPSLPRATSHLSSPITAAAIAAVAASIRTSPSAIATTNLASPSGAGTGGRAPTPSPRSLPPSLATNNDHDTTTITNGITVVTTPMAITTPSARVTASTSLSPVEVDIHSEPHVSTTATPSSATAAVVSSRPPSRQTQRMTPTNGVAAITPQHQQQPPVTGRSFTFEQSSVATNNDGDNGWLTPPPMVPMVAPPSSSSITVLPSGDSMPHFPSSITMDGESSTIAAPSFTSISPSPEPSLPLSLPSSNHEATATVNDETSPPPPPSS